MLKKISYFFVMITFCFITCSCSKDDDRSSDIDDTTNTEGTNYSPSSIIGKTFCPGSEESIVAFTNSTSCSGVEPVVVR